MLEALLNRYPCLSACREALEKAAQALIDCYEKGGKLLSCGNGGSCADGDHIVGELMKGFLKERPLSPERRAQLQASCPSLDDDTLDKLQQGLPAVSLPALTALNMAFCNDVDPELIFAQGVMGLGVPGDVFLGISTSGNAKNVFAAAQVAKGLGLTVIGLTGAGGGKLSQIADITISVPEQETYRVQELHLPVYHYLCAAVEAHFFEK